MYTPEMFAEDVFLNELYDTDIIGVSVPGYPWSKFGSTNAEVLSQHRDVITEAVFYRIKLLLKGNTPSDARKLVEGGYADPLKVFVKREPHPLEKIKTSRFRLICAFSLVSNIITRLLFTDMNEKERKAWGPLRPSALGMGSSDHHLSIMSLWWHLMGTEDIVSVDVSGWDWSVLGHELEMDATRRMVQLGCDDDMLLTVLIKGFYETIKYKVFQLSDGSLYYQDEPGILPSGWYCTTTSNTFMRILVAMMVGALKVVAMGDDAIETWVEDAQSKYLKFGKIVKMYRRCVEDGFVEFCSRKWSMEPGDCKASLTSWPRSVYKLLSGEADEQKLYQVMHEMRYNPELKRVLEVIRSTGWGGPNFWDRTIVSEILKYNDVKNHAAETTAAEKEPQ